MRVSVTEAKGQLTELVRRAEEGEEIILTRHGHPAARILPFKQPADKRTRRALLEALRDAGADPEIFGSAARSQDFLYDERGLPK
jgi:prevent-host-death family protein